MIPFVAFVLSSSILIVWRDYDFWKIPSMGSIFEDLQTLTFNVGCSASSEFWQVSVRGCDPFGRPINYPSIWLKIFRLFEFGPEDTFLLGCIFVASISICVLFWARLASNFKLNHLSSIFFAVIVCTPPIMLLVERGNIDSVIFSGTTLVSYMVMKGRIKAPAILLLLLALAKIFPIGGVLFFAKSARLKSSALILFCFIIYVILFFDDLVKIRRNTPFIENVSFGVGVLPISTFRIFDIQISKVLALVFGGFLLVLFVLVFFIFSVKSKFFHSSLVEFEESFNKFSSSRDVYLLNTGVFIAAYLMGTNFAYRLIFVIPLAAIYLSLWKTSRLSRFLLIAIAGFLILIMGDSLMFMIATTLLLLFTSFLVFQFFWFQRILDAKRINHFFGR